MRAFVKMENGMGQEDVKASGALGGAGAGHIIVRVLEQELLHVKGFNRR